MCPQITPVHPCFVASSTMCSSNFEMWFTADFTRVPPVNPLKIVAADAPKILLVFEVQTNRTDGQNGMNGQTLLIDDVDVWETTANCSESR